MEPARGNLDCPNCGTTVSTWQLLAPKHGMVRCKECGKNLRLTGAIKSVLFGELFYFVVLVIPYILFPDHFILCLLSSMALLTGAYYISMRMFHEVHVVKPVRQDLKA